MKKLGQSGICILLIFIALVCSISVYAETKEKFYMQIDTTLHGVRMGQGFELTYLCTNSFDSISPPEFGMFLEVVKGPFPHRGSSTVIVNGEKKQVELSGFGYHVRFLSEGTIRMPECSVIINGKAYETPPLSVRVQPAKKDIDSVKCDLSTQMSDPQQGELWVKLSCNRRPDSLTPVLVTGGTAYLPQGHGSSLSNTEETYYFTYKVPGTKNGIYVCKLENLSFGGISYPHKEQKIILDEGVEKAPVSDKGNRWILVLIPIIALIVAGLALFFRKRNR